MKILIVVMIGLGLGWITIQDFMERKVSLVALIVLFALCILFYSLAHQIRELPLRIMVNFLFASIILVSGTLLVKIRRPKDSILSFIGAGDFLFLFVISPVFSFESYLVFLNTSIILTLLVFGVLLHLKRYQAQSTIPLAGALSACLIAFLILDQVIPDNILEEISWFYMLMS